MKSKIRFADNRPMIDIDGLLYPPLAYTTYFDECGQWSDFIRSGYRMFFVNVSFTDLPINNTTGFSPFLTGVFEKAEPDYSEFDKERVIVFSCADEAFKVEASESLSMKIWTSTGILVKEVELSEGANIVDTSGLSGLYILDCVFKYNYIEK